MGGSEMPLITCPHCAGVTTHYCDSCAKGEEGGVCLACRGDGKVTIPDPAITCPHCDGKTIHGCGSCAPGDQEIGICSVCHGTGKIAPGDSR